MDYAALLALLKARRSIRRFEDRPVSREQIECLVEAARWAPSNANRQGWKVVAVDRSDTLAALAGAIRAGLSPGREDPSVIVRGHSDHLTHCAAVFERAPCVLLVLHKRPAAVARRILGPSPYSDWISGEAMSAAMAVQNMLLAAEALGLGACVLTAPLTAYDAVATVMEAPADWEPTCLLALGHPAERPEPPRRKRLENLLEYR